VGVLRTPIVGRQFIVNELTGAPAGQTPGQALLQFLEPVRMPDMVAVIPLHVVITANRDKRVEH
jgi:hypothetical protein